MFLVCIFGNLVFRFTIFILSIFVQICTEDMLFSFDV